ncbi:FecR family protein [Spirochaeta dissipatitropha]
MLLNYKRRVLAFLAAVIIFPIAASADSQAVITYYENENAIQITDADGFEYDFVHFGMELREGDRIRTGASVIELRVLPSESLLRISDNSDFTLEGLSGTTFTANLQEGRVRSNVRTSQQQSAFAIRTRSTVGGVRGTDFVMNVVPDQKEALYVVSGEVEFTAIETNESIRVSAGQTADFFAELFTPVPVSDAELQEILQGMEFDGETPAPAAQTEEQEDTEAEDSQEDVVETVEESEEVPAVEPTPADPPAAVDMAPPTPATTPSLDQTPTIGADAEDVLLETIGRLLNMEIGSITMGGETYGKIVLQPEFNFGKLGLGLYLPVIYTNNLFNPASWYQPAGNNEWSFGTDQEFAGEEDEVWLRIQDFWRDLWLKIRYVNWGAQRDPFYFQAGNVSSMTLGHGILMRRYANDTDFPQVRRIGLNLGVSRNKLGFETVINDLSKPEIAGLRLFTRPFHPATNAAIGLSAVADINPAGDTAVEDATIHQQRAIESQPVFLSFAADLDVPVIENNLLSIILFADAGVFLPYLRNSSVDNAVQDGFQTQLLFDSDDFDINTMNNYGAITGILGNILIMDYRLEYRYLKGLFSPFYNQIYDRYRTEIATQLMQQIAAPEDFSDITQGVFGEASFQLFSQSVLFDLGYFLPWNKTLTGDYLQAALTVAPDFLPFGINGELYYVRYGFAAAIADQNVSLFDPQTSFGGSLNYPIVPGMQLSIVLDSFAKRDGSGRLVYDENGRLQTEFSVSFETRIGY